MLQVIDVVADGCSYDAVTFLNEQSRLVIAVRGIIGNSVPTSERGRQALVAWKRAVMATVKAARRAQMYPTSTYAVTGAFRFHPYSHGNNKLDIENYLKPTFDGLAAGLFCKDETDPFDVVRYNYDDSGFRYLFAYRLSDATLPGDEGVDLVVSVLGNPA